MLRYKKQFDFFINRCLNNIQLVRFGSNIRRIVGCLAASNSKLRLERIALFAVSSASWSPVPPNLSWSMLSYVAPRMRELELSDRFVQEIAKSDNSEIMEDILEHCVNLRRLVINGKVKSVTGFRRGSESSARD